MLSNKLALVTGAASGLGKAVALTLAKNGANVALVDLDKNSLNVVADEIKEKCRSIKIITSSHACDVSQSAEVNNLLSEIKHNYSNQVPSILVNSAGITRDSFLLKMSEKQFDQVISVNLKGTFLVTQCVARTLVEHLKKHPLDDSVRSYGSIINLASVVGKYGNLGQANYAASKAGVEGFTRTTAKELGKYKIRCNAILPGRFRYIFILN
jgi:17beta-estradiol 17-dehydrogenase/3alpha(17beta)-hydroxysteroid dehydrogenase (NAD+)